MTIKSVKAIEDKFSEIVVVECDISVRTLNCLKAEDIEIVGDLTHKNKTDLLKFRSFGKKCLIEIDDLLNELGLEWGTNYMVNENGEVVKLEIK